MKRCLSMFTALVCLLALPLGCAPQNTPSLTTTTTSEVTTTEKTAESTTTVKDAPSSTKAAVTTTTTKKQTTTISSTTKTYRTLETSTTHTAQTTASTSVDTVSVTTTSSRRTVSSRTKPTTPTTNPNNPDNPFEISYPITPSMSIEDSSWRIKNNVTPKSKLPSEVAAVTQFDPNWGFTHHPAGIEYFKGKFYVSFSRGYTGEDMPGQQAVLCTSEDFYHWSEPQVIVPATQGRYGETCAGPGPMYVADGKLFYTYGVSDYSKEYFDSHGNFNPRAKGTRVDELYRIYTEDGVNWSEPEPMSASGMVYYLRQNLTGRWMACYGPSWVHHSDAKIPDGVNWNCYVMPSDMRKNSEKRNGGTLHESAWYQSFDGVIHLMVRSDNGVLWQAESYDNGETFTEHYPTRFSSKNTQFNFYNLPDGRPIAVGSPASSTSVWDAWPLNIYISNDGYNFDTAYILRDERYTMRQTGYSKGGEYAYMKFLVHDGYFYVFYSKMKEVMEVTRVRLVHLEN